MKTFLELAEEINYDEWKLASEKLNSDVDAADKKLKGVIGDTSKSGGSVPDDIKNSPQFKKADKEYKIAFKKLQNFNKTSPKAYMKQHTKDRRASWRNK